VATYKTLNEEYVPSAPVKVDEAKVLRKLIPLDIRFLLGNGLKWTAITSPAPAEHPSGGAAAPVEPAEAAENPDRSASNSPVQAVDRMKNFLAWNPTDLGTIPFHEMVFATDIEFTKNRLYHAVAILFFLHPTLPTNYPELSDAIHAGWMATFKHPMNFEELRLPPSVGPDAYTDEEQKWCDGTLNWLVANLDVAGRQSRGIPESAVKQRAPRGRAAAAAGAAAARPGAAAAAAPATGPGPVPGPAGPTGRGRGGGAGGQGGRGAGRAAARAAAAMEDITEGRKDTESDNETMETTQPSRRKRGRSQSRCPHFGVFSVMFDILRYI
jgi:hypothetical protein